MDISDTCKICKQPNDQMLMLACDHDPCINCAASAYAESVHIKSNDPNVTDSSYLGLCMRSLWGINTVRSVDCGGAEATF